MRHVDALSRAPVVRVVTSGVLQSIKKSQADDTACKAIREVLSTKTYENYVLRCDILYKGVDGHYLLVVRKLLQTQIIQSAHEHGHINAAKVEAIVKQEYAIDNLHRKVARVLANCVPCILSSRKAGNQEGMYNLTETMDVPLHTYHIDHLEQISFEILINSESVKKYQLIFNIQI